MGWKIRHLLPLALLWVGTGFALNLNSWQNPRGVVPLIPPTYHGLQRYFIDSTLFQSPFSGFERKVYIDSTGRFVDVEETVFGWHYLLPVRADLEYFVQQQLNRVNREKFREITLRYLHQAQEVGGGGIQLNIPVRIKSKAFKRIFGGDQVGLRVSGNITFELSGRQEKRSGSALNSFDQGGVFSPRFKQTQQFRVEGKVGDKVTVSVDQNSEATFDFENTLKLVYQGDEDEIVQKLEAGNVALSLPQTRFVSVNANHQGLFGLKSQMRVGNFKFTGIASLQRGENEKITKTGSATENTFRIRDYEYVRDRFFFVDSLYLELFSNFNERMVWQLPANLPIKILQLDVWISTRQSDPDKPRQAYATLDPNEFIQRLNAGEDPNTFPIQAGFSESGFFKRLEFGKDYDYDEYRGYFWLNRQVNDQDVIAISYITEADTIGMPFQVIDENTPIVILKLIKPRAAKPEFRSTWALAMRNVYNLGASGISPDGFDVKILFYKTGEDLDVDPVTGKTFNFLMGLDRLNEQGNLVDGGDKIIDVRNGWIFDLAHGYLIFPELTPFDPPPGSRFAFGDSTLAVKIYNLKDRTEEINRSKFELEITTRAVSSTFDLGFNVLEGSEVVRLNGRVLERDRDYTIDYFSGQLQILAPEARRADAQVEIEYERGSLFQLDKKTLLGGRVDYEFGERNFIGLTTLFFNQTTLDQRIRIGQEPIKNFIWDLNAAFTFKPNFLSWALDKLPIVETSAESRLNLEAELAQVKPNPNTFNEKRLGETNGVAYIDDFEGSKRFTTLGIGFRTWSFASVPVRFRIPDLGIDYSQPDDPIAAARYIRQMDRNRVQFNWFNPFTPVPIKDIWPEKDVNAQTGTTTNVLNLRWRNENIPRDSAWAGIMRSTITFPDQKKTKFIELWVLGDVGRVNIDIGKISEDYWVRGTIPESGLPSLGFLNTEDKNGNGLLDEDEDVGIDGIPDGQEDGTYDDNWAPPGDTDPPFLRINGTEGNSDAQGARYPDTEDLNENGIVDLTNEYFSYSFDLSDQSHPYIKGRTEKGWRLYRIPIREPEFVVGNPDTNFQEIFAVRLWLNNLEPDGEYHFISIATFEFVGNEWEEQGVFVSDTLGGNVPDSAFAIAVYNTEENVREVPGGPEAYHSPPNVTGIRDRITRALSKEQSLVLQLRYLPVGATAEARKQLAEKINMLHYRKMKAFVHGDRNLPGQNSPLEFFIRFGPTSDIYYEFGEKVYPHWDERNNVEIDFDELTRTKQDEFVVDTLNNRPVYYRTVPGHPEKYFKVVGNPGLHNINYFVIGARNVGGEDIQGMEIWVDELRVTDVERETGTAMRLFADLDLADVATVRGQWEMVDDNFRRLEQKFPSTTGRDMNKFKQNYFLKLQLDKFLPEGLGLNIPVTGNITRAQNVPKYFFNSDRRTHFRPQGVDRFKAFFGLMELDPDLEAISTINESRSIGATFQRRRSLKSPWYLRHTLDRLMIDVDYSETHNSNANVLFQDGKKLSARVQYSLDFGPNNFFRPFAWLGNAPVIRALSRTKLYYTPRNASFNFTLNDNESRSQSRLESNHRETINTTTSRSMNVTYRLTENLNIDYNRTHRADAFLRGYRAGDVLQAIVNKLDFGVDKNITQRFNASYNPRIFNWISHSFRYNADFNYNLNNPEIRDRSANLNVSRQITVDFKPALLANSIYNPLTRARAPSPRHRPRGRPGQHRKETGKEQDQQEPEKETSEEKENKEKSDGKSAATRALGAINPLKLLWHFLNAWKSTRLDYTIQDNVTHYNLGGVPGFEYQFGFTRSPNVGIDTSFNKVLVQPNLRKNRRLNVSTTLDIMRNLNSTFRYSFDHNRTENNQQRREALSSGYFFTGDDPDASHKPWKSYIPDWRLQLTGLEKIPFFQRFAQSVTVEHARSGKFSETNKLKGTEKERDQWSYSNNYQPLLGINITTRWGVTASIRYIKSVTFNYNSTSGVRKSQQSGFNINASYSVRQGFRIPLPFLNKKKLRNEIQFSLAFDKSSNFSFTRTPGETEFEELDRQQSWKLRPSATYRFSEKVNGSMFFELGRSENKITGAFSWFEFGINVNIAIR